MMKKLFSQEKVETFAKNIARESPNVMSAFIFYEPKMPKSLVEKLEKMK